MRIVCTVFAPFLVAIGIRAILFILAIIIGWLAGLGESITLLDKSTMHEIVDFAEAIGGFKTFLWNESWLFWILVLIGTFIAELNIWDNDIWQK